MAVCQQFGSKWNLLNVDQLVWLEPDQRDVAHFRPHSHSSLSLWEKWFGLDSVDGSLKFIYLEGRMNYLPQADGERQELPGLPLAVVDSALEIALEMSLLHLFSKTGLSTEQRLLQTPSSAKQKNPPTPLWRWRRAYWGATATLNAQWHLLI